MEPLVNKVAESGIVTINLEQFLPSPIVVFDLKNFLFMELILKEKDFREALQSHDWNQYNNQYVAITCSVDAIIPVWAYMLITNYLDPVVKELVVGTEEQAREYFLLQNIHQLDPSEYTDKRLVIKGCGEEPIPAGAYALITKKLKPIAKSIMYGEPCSTVPIFKRKQNIN